MFHKMGKKFEKPGAKMDSYDMPQITSSVIAPPRRQAKEDDGGSPKAAMKLSIKGGGLSAMKKPK